MAISSNRSPSPISNRTTNPNPRTPESNNNIRKSFSGNPLKKHLFVRNSKSFNPVTPANSPSEFSQRNSGSKEGMSSLGVSYEYKENEKDQNLKLAKVRSPSISMGSKNFMAPTISAVSKITASPRKKILGEINEVARSSDSTFSEKLSFALEIGSNQELVSGFQVPPKVLSSNSIPSENSSFLGEIEPKLKLYSGSHVPSETLNSNINSAPKSIIRSSIPHSDGNPLLKTKNSYSCSVMEENPSKQDEDSMNSELSSITQNISESLPEPTSETIKVKPFSSPSPALVPLDLDPSLPPYDPKTNYLSPRPLFLRYKPNPRIEVYLNKELGFNSGEEGKQLEDSFTSESCSYTENTEVTQNSDPQKESEDELSEAISEVHNQTLLQEIVEKQEEAFGGKEFSKSRSFARSKITSLLLVFVVACLSFTVTDTPIYSSHSTLKDHTFSKLETPAKMVGLGELKSIDLVYHFKLWLAKSTSYLSELSSFSRTVEKICPFYSVNLTLLDQENPHEHQTVLYGDNETDEKQEENDLETEEEKETEEPKDEQSFLRIEMDEKEEVIMEEFKDQSPLISQAAEIKPEMLEAVESHDEDDLYSHINFDSASLKEKVENNNGFEPREEGETEEEQEEQQNFLEIQSENNEKEMSTEELKEQSPLASEFETEMVESEDFQEEDDIDSHSNTEHPNLEITHNSESDNSPQSSAMDNSLQNPGFETVESLVHDLADKFLKQTTMLQISLVLLTLITASTFLYLKSSKNASSAVAEISVKQLQPRKLASSSASIDSKRPQTERFSSQNWATEEDMLGQSGPSEMSISFQNSSSYRQRESETEDEMQSHERNAIINRNRESSSEYSAGSPSYGSFTTYEKIYKKHGCGDEVVTPVRRSSRIKKQIIST